MKLFRYGIYLISVLVPLGLLVDSKAIFYSGADWSTHLWLIAYFGEHFRHYLGMPTVLTAAPSVGMAVPLFYGYLLYPILGFFSAFIGASLALRLGCLLMMALQFYALYCAGRAAFRHRGLAYAAAVTVIWSTYALTDLYNRSAIPEYFATGFLMAAIGFTVAAAAESGEGSPRFHAWMAGVSVLLAMGMHPPTAVVSGVFFAALGAVISAVWIYHYRRLRWSGIALGFAGAALGLLILSPWFYITLRIGPRLLIWGGPNTLLFYPDRCDSWFGRLSPMPYDWLSVHKGIDVSTPYLEAPIAFGGLILVGWFLAIWMRSSRPAVPAMDNLWAGSARFVAPLALGWFGFLLALSLSLPLATHFQFLGPYLQFAYRLVSHCNAALATAVFAAGALACQRGALAGRRHQADVIAAVCITMAALAMILKLTHGSPVAVDQGSPEYALGGDRAPLIASGLPYLIEYYTTPAAVLALPDGEAPGATRMSFPVGQKGSKFGQVETTQVRLDQPGWVVTNALVFPWSRIWVNGRRSGGDDLRRQGSFLAVHLPAGTANLRWEWHPDPVWSCLHTISQIAFICVMLVTTFWFVARGLASWARHKT
jgi:hypothetical protein